MLEKLLARLEDLEEEAGAEGQRIVGSKEENGRHGGWGDGETRG